MFETFRNAWKTEDLRKRLLYTLLILILFRLGCAIPVPYITSSALESMFTTGSMLTYLNMMSGGAMSRCTIFALGVQPYINATIIIQLLCVAIPYLENLSKEGEEGRQKLTKISNYTGAAIALLFSILKVTPAPFCFFDEVEAALDDVNVTRYAQYARRMTKNTQFILITHRRGTMEEADVLYGVTMQEDGVSKLLELKTAEMAKKLGLTQ